MPDDRGVLREIAWREIFPWLSIVRCARLALTPRLLILAALGIFATALGWQAIGKLYSGAEAFRQPTVDEPAPKYHLDWIDTDGAWPWQTQLASPPPRTIGDFNPIGTPVGYVWSWLGTPFVRMFTPGIGIVPFTYSLLCGLWELAVWALVGGAITRIVALALARESRVGFVEGLRFGGVKWPQFFLAALLPLLGVVVLSIVVGVVFGVIMRADFGVLLMSIFWPLLLLASLAMAILLLGLAFGWALMWPTVGVEKTDSFDAISRSYSYTFQRPFHYLFYAIVAGAIGLLAAYVVAYFVFWTNHLAMWSASWGGGMDRIGELQAHVFAGGVPADSSWTLRAGVGVLRFWTGCVAILGFGYLVSYFWTAATAIYYLLRQSVDGTEPDEVAVEQEDETFGLPPLKNDPSGVPQVADPEKSGK